jgi:hypothetical protein
VLGQRSSWSARWHVLAMERCGRLHGWRRCRLLGHGRLGRRVGQRRHGLGRRSELERRSELGQQRGERTRLVMHGAMLHERVGSSSIGQLERGWRIPRQLMGRRMARLRMEGRLSSRQQQRGRTMRRRTAKEEKTKL